MLADGGGTQQREQTTARSRLDSVMVCDAARVSCHTPYFRLRRRATRCPCRLCLSRLGTRRFSACARRACPQGVITSRQSLKCHSGGRALNFPTLHPFVGCHMTRAAELKV